MHYCRENIARIKQFASTHYTLYSRDQYHTYANIIPLKHYKIDGFTIHKSATKREREKERERACFAREARSIDKLRLIILHRTYDFGILRLLSWVQLARTLTRIFLDWNSEKKRCQWIGKRLPLKWIFVPK